MSTPRFGSRLFEVHGKGGAILDGGRVASSTNAGNFAWVRVGAGLSEGTHTWRLRVRRGFRCGTCCGASFLAAATDVFLCLCAAAMCDFERILPSAMALLFDSSIHFAMVATHKRARVCVCMCVCVCVLSVSNQIDEGGNCANLRCFGLVDVYMEPTSARFSNVHSWMVAGSGDWAYAAGALFAGACCCRGGFV